MNRINRRRRNMIKGSRQYDALRRLFTREQRKPVIDETFLKAFGKKE